MNKELIKLFSEHIKLLKCTELLTNYIYELEQDIEDNEPRARIDFVLNDVIDKITELNNTVENTNDLLIELGRKV